MNHLLRQLSEDFILFFEKLVLSLPNLPSVIAKKWIEFKVLLEKPENLLSIHTFVINLYTEGIPIDFLPRKVSLESSFKKTPLDLLSSPTKLPEKSLSKKEEFGLISIGNDPKVSKVKKVNDQKYVMLDDAGRRVEACKNELNGGKKEEVGIRQEEVLIREVLQRKEEVGNSKKEAGGGNKKEEVEKNKEGGGKNEKPGERKEETNRDETGNFKFDFRNEVLKKFGEEGKERKDNEKIKETPADKVNEEKEEIKIKFVIGSPEGMDRLEKLKSESPKKVTFTPTEESPPYLTPIQTKFNPFKIKIKGLGDERTPGVLTNEKGNYDSPLLNKISIQDVNRKVSKFSFQNKNEGFALKKIELTSMVEDFLSFFKKNRETMEILHDKSTEVVTPIIKENNNFTELSNKTMNVELKKYSFFMKNPANIEHLDQKIQANSKKIVINNNE